MGTVRETAAVVLPPASAEQLWADTNRWPTFIDGFKRVVEQDPRWPGVGSKVVWESGPAGRGRVTERVTVNAPGRFETEVYEEQITGTQTVTFEMGDQDTLVTIALDYRLQKGGPLRALTDVIFIRRALAEMLRRTLRRFATEAAEQGSL
jgi:hypothetical protein